MIGALLIINYTDIREKKDVVSKKRKVLINAGSIQTNKLIKTNKNTYSIEMEIK